MCEKNYDLVMLYSGGADSRLMIQWALEFGRIPLCVLIDYGQKHVRELEYAKQQLDSLDVSWKVITVKDLDVDSGLTGLLDEGRWDNVHAMNVPGRNSIFISLAYSIAENYGITEIWYGPDFDDFLNKFPDCYQTYVGKMNEVLAIAGVRPIKLYAPLLGWTKEMILNYLKKIVGVELCDIHSGYEEPKHKTFCENPRCMCKNCTEEGC